MAWKALWIVIAAAYQVAAADYNFTYSMAHRCKEHLSTGGYHYSPFYRVSPTATYPGVNFEMHLAILAASNGHILLSPIDNPGPSDPVYEIVLGGGANRFSELRRMQRRLTKTSERTVGILSPVDFRAFWIKITDDGSVDVGREGESIPFLHWEDPDPLSVSYFSFASWTNVEAKFLYECPVAGDDAAEDATKSEVVLPNLTTAQQLKVDLLGSRSPLTPPAPRVHVQLGVTLASVQYDAAGSVLETLVGVVSKWRDEQIVWDPDKYNGTTDLLFRQREIWKPEFYVHNSVGIGALESKTTEPIYFLSSGVAVLHTRATVSSWCEDDRPAMSAWPRDQYSCHIYIGPWEMHEEIHMESLETSSKENLENLLENKFISNEWEVISAGYAIVPSTYSPYRNLTCVGDVYPEQNSLLALELNIRRRGAIDLVLYTPLITVTVFLLMSFWMEPLSLPRVWFHGGTAVLLCTLITYIDAMVPSHKVPSIVVLYEVVLLASLVAMLLHLVLMLPALENSYTSGYLRALVSVKLLRFVCCLPPLKTYSSLGAETEGLEVPEPGPPSDRRLEQMQSEPPPKARGPRLETAGAIDRAVFVLYTVLFSVLLACHY